MTCTRPSPIDGTIDEPAANGIVVQGIDGLWRSCRESDSDRSPALLAKIETS